MGDRSVNSAKSKSKIGRVILSDSESESDSYYSDVEIDLSKKEVPRLADTNYTGPIHKWTLQDVKNKLKGYIRVGDIDDLSTGIHVRYFKIEDNGETSFKPGGLLIINAQDYVVLKSYGGRWSVQKTVVPRSGDNRGRNVATIFYRKMTELDRDFIKLKREVSKQNKQIDKIGMTYKNPEDR